jgi:hypothetical protein
MGSNNIDFGVLLFHVPLIGIPNYDAHVITSRKKEEPILAEASNRVHMTIHFTPPLTSFELVNLYLIEVASDNQISILGLILVFKVMDAKNLVALLDSQVDVLAVVD